MQGYALTVRLIIQHITGAVLVRLVRKIFGGISITTAGKIRASSIQRDSGYTLIELSLVVLIISIISAGGLQVFQKKTEADRMKVTIQRLDAIEGALKQFYQVNRYLPCPALPNVADGNASYGITPTTTTNDYDTTNHVCLKTFVAACNSSSVYNMCDAGVPPVRTLNLPDEYMYDGWDRRFTYRVAGGMGNVDDFFDKNYRGDISVVDTFGNELTDINNPSPNNYGAAYVLFSHGRNGYYSWLKSGYRYSPGTAPGIETENNNHYSNKRYIQDIKSVYFDDITRFKKKSDLEPPKIMVAPIRISQSVCNDAEMIVQNGTGTLQSNADAATARIAYVSSEVARFISSLCQGKRPSQTKCIPNYVWAGPNASIPFPNKLIDDCQPNGTQYMLFNLAGNVGLNSPNYTVTLKPATHCRNSASGSTIVTGVGTLDTGALNSEFYLDGIHSTSVWISYTDTLSALAATGGTLKVQSIPVTGTYTSPSWNTASAGALTTVTSAGSALNLGAGVLVFEVIGGTCSDNSTTNTLTITIR